MAEKPTDVWRARAEKHPESAELFPESMLKRTDEVLAGFEAEVSAFAGPADDDVPALAARRGLGRHEITDEWRYW